MRELTNREINQLKTRIKGLGFKVFDKPYELNIVGERNDITEANKFDDKIFVFWKDDKGKWSGKEYKATTDPGTYWLKAPMNVNGTAILKAGQYIDAYTTGLHKGKPALRQNKPVTVIRDYDRNAILDFNNGKEYTGNFTINIHRAGTASTEVNDWSAGCQVFANESDFLDFLKLVEKDKQLNGDAFTYTLIDERAANRTFKRILAYNGALLIGAVAVYVLYRSYKKLPIIPASVKKLFQK
jgi:hypothetical protein